MLVDILVRDNKPYTFENYACKKSRTFFEKWNIQTRKIVLSEGVFHDYLMLLQESPPDWTMAFEEIFFLQKPFCDIVKIPHFYWKGGSLSTAVYYFDSTHGKVGCSDRRVAHHFGHPFFPFPSEKKESERAIHRPFDVVLFQDLIDLESKKNTWKILFGEKGSEILLEAVDMCHKNPSLHPVIVGLQFKNAYMNLSDLIFELEEYLTAERTLLLVESLTNVHIHVFGEHVGNNWLRRLKNREHVHLHALLPYTERFEVLKMAKILIRDQPLFSETNDEWILHALNAGCFVFSNPNPYLLQLYPGIDCFYQSYEELNEKIQKALPAQIPDLPQEILQQNSWEIRLKEIIHYMKSL